jgi:hypothetical protein
VHEWLARLPHVQRTRNDRLTVSVGRPDQYQASSTLTPRAILTGRIAFRDYGDNNAQPLRAAAALHVTTRPSLLASVCPCGAAAVEQVGASSARHRAAQALARTPSVLDLRGVPGTGPAATMDRGGGVRTDLRCLHSRTAVPLVDGQAGFSVDRVVRRAALPTARTQSHNTFVHYSQTPHCAAALGPPGTNILVNRGSQVCKFPLLHAQSDQQQTIRSRSYLRYTSRHDQPQASSTIDTVRFLMHLT